MTESSEVMPIHNEAVKILKPKDTHMATLPKRGSTLTVILKPHNNAFQTRTLELREKAKTRIGRQTSTKTTPTTFNGYFDSKVLSRQHAEIWCEKTKVYVKDVKSSNGTFVNGDRLSDEGEESEPKELHDQDEIEFGIDILNDNGAIMYHKVSCSVYIFPVPLSQVDDGIIKELSNNHHAQVYPDSHALSRKSSASSINTISSASSEMTNGSSSTIAAMSAAGTGLRRSNSAAGKKSKKLESVLARLQAEIEKSKRVENELKTIKETVVDLDKIFSEDKLRKSDELQVKLNQAEATIKSYDDKWKHQNQAIQTAKGELCKLEKQISSQKLWKAEKDKLEQELAAERQKVKDLEDRVEMLSRQQQQQQQNKKSVNGRFLDAVQIESVQIAFAVLIGAISALLYILYN